MEWLWIREDERESNVAVVVAKLGLGRNGRPRLRSFFRPIPVYYLSDAEIHDPISVRMSKQPRR